SLVRQAAYRFLYHYRICQLTSRRNPVFSSPCLPYPYPLLSSWFVTRQAASKDHPASNLNSDSMSGEGRRSESIKSAAPYLSHQWPFNVTYPALGGKTFNR